MIHNSLSILIKFAILPQVYIFSIKGEKPLDIILFRCTYFEFTHQTQSADLVLFELSFCGSQGIETSPSILDGRTCCSVKIYQ